MAHREDILFGELRSLFQRQPSLRAWYRLAQLIEQLTEPAWADQHLPYILSQLSRPGWSSMPRPAPRRWCEALLDGSAQPPVGLSLITELRLDRGSVYGVSPHIWNVALCGARMPHLERLILYQDPDKIREGAGVADEGFSQPLINTPATLVFEDTEPYEALWGLSKLWSPQLRPDGSPALHRLSVERGQLASFTPGLIKRGLACELGDPDRLEWPSRLRVLELRRAGATMEVLGELASIPQVRALDELGLSPQAAQGPGEPWEQAASLSRALAPDGQGPQIS